LEKYLNTVVEVFVITGYWALSC